MQPEKQPSKGTWSPLRVIINKFLPGTKKEEQLQVTDDQVSPPESFQLADQDSYDLKSSLSSDRYQFSFRSPDKGVYAEVDGRPLAQQPASAAGDVKINADLGSAETTTRGAGGKVRQWHKGRLDRKVSSIMQPDKQPSKRSWSSLRLIIGKFIPGNPQVASGTAKKKEQLHVTADQESPPCSYPIEVPDSTDIESSLSSERFQYSFRSDSGNYAEVDGRTLAQQPASATGDGEVNADLGGTESPTRGREERWWQKGRFSRKVKYPDAVNELLFQKSELWTYVAPVGGMMMVVVSYHNYGIISNEWKEDLLLFLLGAMASLKLGKTLQKELPELAVVLMVAADGLLIAPYVIVTLNVLPKDPLGWKHWVLYSIIICFTSTYCPCLYQIYKEDVREREEARMPTRYINVEG